MQRVVIEEPYKFVPPYRGKNWIRLFKLYLPRYLRRADGLHEWECRGAERLRASMDAGHGIVLCPNHCRPSDPMAMGLVTIAARCETYSMASWHVFKQSWLQAFMTRRLGAFSIYREGLDRTALNTAIDIVTRAERPLVVFPEGVISRCNDHLLALMDGTAFIARSAARKRAKQDPNKKVVIHPVALRYEFKGDIHEAVCPILDKIEKRLTWRKYREDDITTRIRRIAIALLSLKEVQYTGRTVAGDPYDRLERLIDRILEPIETEWLGGLQEGTVVSRVKQVRTAILPDLIAPQQLEKPERRRRRLQLADVYLAQQLSLYPRGYVDHRSPPERILETVERIEEDLTDNCRVHRPLKLVMQIGEPIEMDTKRPRGGPDPIMTSLREKLTDMIGELGDEIHARREQSAPELTPVV